VRLWDLRYVPSSRHITDYINLLNSAQSRQAIQILDEARDTVQTLHVGSSIIIAGSVDGHVRTYDLRKGELRSDYIGCKSFSSTQCQSFTIIFISDPITSILPTNDSQTLLIATLDSTIRLLDLSTGKILNTFKSHTNTSYRTRACFGFGEASVVSGDENGVVWAWDLVDVRRIVASLDFDILRCGTGGSFATKSTAEGARQVYNVD
jgi:mitogen-activated protein kinase organizer 1